MDNNNDDVLEKDKPRQVEALLIQEEIHKLSSRTKYKAITLSSAFTCCNTEVIDKWTNQ